MSATNTQLNEDRQVLHGDHRLRLLAQHDRSVNDILPTGALLSTGNIAGPEVAVRPRRLRSRMCVGRMWSARPDDRRLLAATDNYSTVHR